MDTSSPSFVAMVIAAFFGGMGIVALLCKLYLTLIADFNVERSRLLRLRFRISVAKEQYTKYPNSDQFLVNPYDVTALPTRPNFTDTERKLDTIEPNLLAYRGGFVMWLLVKMIFRNYYKNILENCEKDVESEEKIFDRNLISTQSASSGPNLAASTPAPATAPASTPAPAPAPASTSVTTAATHSQLASLPVINHVHDHHHICNIL